MSLNLVEPVWRPEISPMFIQLSDSGEAAGVFCFLPFQRAAMVSEALTVR